MQHIPDIQNIDAANHLRGESVYLDDITVVNGTLYGAVYDSPVAHGIIRQIHVADAINTPGVVRVFTAADIPGENQIGGIVPDEPLLAEQEVHFRGMPVAFVVAVSEDAAREAVRKIKADIDPLPVITDPRVAMQQGHLIIPPRTFVLGDTAKAWKKCKHIFEGTADTNGQEHLYIETQGAYAVPQEHGIIRIYSSTQGPTAVQRHCSRVLGVPMHRIEVDVTRLGGGFGGKEDQATAWGVLCALAAFHLNRPVKLALHRMDDMRMTGKRHPYSSDFRIGLDNNLKILAYEATFYQNAGASADLSPAVMERTLFHCTNAYYVPNVTATAYSCRTNLPSNTAFRGFGGPQGMFVIEAAIAMAAEALNVPASKIQKKNLMEPGEEFPYGQKSESEAARSWKKAEKLYNFDQMQQEAEAFNRKNFLVKKGIAMMPICFGISFTKTMMNQGRALVHVYMDGSVSVSTGAVEMGQGVNTKILQVAATCFQLDPAAVKVHTTSTFRIANTSPSAASATADLNGKAVEIACLAILDRLKAVAAEEFKTEAKHITIRDGYVYARDEKTTWTWQTLVVNTYYKRISLSEHAHYTPPGIHFDLKKEKGHPFAYHVYGTAAITVTVDCLRGTYAFDSVKIVHDFGKSMNTLVDRGQMEGGVVQGIGWMTMEELLYDDEGKLLSNALSTYKVPDLYSAPAEITIHPLKPAADNFAIFQSKAVGEPPLLYGIGAYFALRNAIRSFNPGARIPYSAPMTAEKVLMHLYDAMKPDDATDLQKKDAR
ncbi:MAG TPA: molybdopterin cofactor-binding domain-containing protein [Flavisolibacter sp.]